MSILIQGGTLLTPDLTLEGSSLLIEGDRIIAIQSTSKDVPAGFQVIDAHGLLVAPGLIDVHIHGSDGSDTMDATPEALHTISAYILKHGVTSYLPTTMTATSGAISAAIENVERTPQPKDGAQHLGVHLEGPYLSMQLRGAQPAESIRPPDAMEYSLWLSSKSVRLVTVAPEIPGTLDLISQGVAHGVHFSVGHSQATFEQVEKAADAGLDQATHTFNGMIGLHHREPGPVGAVLTDERIFAQMIVDGIHLHPGVVRLIITAKGIDRTILITDAMRATGLPDGEYDLGGQLVNVQAGIARTQAGSLAGSTLTLDQAVRNAFQFAGLTPNQALAMATRVPAESIGLGGKKGILKEGADADIILLDEQLHVRASIVAGQLAYSVM